MDAKFFNSSGKRLAKRKYWHVMKLGVSVLAVSLRYFAVFPELTAFRRARITGVKKTSFTLVNEMHERVFCKYHSFYFACVKGSKIILALYF